MKPNLPKRRVISVDDLAHGVRSGNRASLGRAVTLIESTNHSHQQQAQQLIQQLLPYTGNSIRIGLSGVPGVGKSTFIEAFGQNLLNEKKKVAVLAIDPTSQRTGGSILGDKTRMQSLSIHADAFVRPSPTSGTLGGVNRVTRESILLCEAAGFDVIIVETVGVGQSETSVSTMVDFFLLLMLPGAGDDLQGIKRGLMEVADMIVINKSDGDNLHKAQTAKNDYTHAIRTLFPPSDKWQPPVLNCSAILNQGLTEVWLSILKHQQIAHDSGLFKENRQQQSLDWLDSTLRHRLLSNFHSNKEVADKLDQLRTQVITGKVTPVVASEILINQYQQTNRF
ncbi:ATPase/protein kinase [Chromatiales bacterium (ex Bugula neritina AB1)]|nr:ATPase/protein kinase [Chromatiales bacterium (ex Bugula neritina AB1)]